MNALFKFFEHLRKCKDFSYSASHRRVFYLKKMCIPQKTTFENFLLCDEIAENIQCQYSDINIEFLVLLNLGVMDIFGRNQSLLIESE